MRIPPLSGDLQPADKTILAALGRTLRRHWAAWLLAVIVFFLVFPSVDLTVSGWFWQADGGWIYGRLPFNEFIRKRFPVILFAIVALLTLLWAAGLLLKRRLQPLRGLEIFYLLSTLAVGPGVLANGLFKEHWHRARPGQIEQFGGSAHYTPPLMITDQCMDNCSFVSGHGALGFWVVAFAFLLPPRWRGTGIVAGFLFGCMVGGVRIIQGGHFLSDVVFSAILVLSVCWGWWKMLLAPPAGRPPAPPVSLRDAKKQAL